MSDIETPAQGHAFEPTAPQRVTPFPYPGNKRRIAEWVVANMIDHERFVAPFGGAGGILFNKAPSRNEVLNDINEDIITFYRVLRDRRDELKEYLSLIPYHEQQYDEWKREWDKSWRPDDDVKHAGQFYFLQRASFGGDQTGFRAVANGRKNSSSQYFNSLDRLDAFSERLDGVILHNKDYKDIIAQYGDDENALVYMDPPYSRGTERYDWVDFDHWDFNNFVVKMGESENTYSGHWMLSTASVPLYIGCYPTIETDVVHQIGGDGAVTEKLTMSYHPDEVERFTGGQRSLDDW